MKKIALLLMFSMTLSSMLAQKYLRPVDEVDPFIGSVNSRWFFFTPAALPFGMARLGPHTNAHYGNPSGWEPVGYDYRHSSIEGFGHFHEFQIGGIVLMPLTGKLRTTPGDTVKPFSGYRSSFDKKSEKAMPGYYSVFLKDHGVKAELTATKRVGFHRYTFPAGKPAHVIINVGNRQGESGQVLEAFVQKKGDYEIEGGVVTLPEYVRSWDSTSRVKMYFVARFEKPVRSFGTFIGDRVKEGASKAEGPGCGMYVTLDPKDQKPVGVKVGLSYISPENARQNLEQEAGNLSFDACKQQAIETWNKDLSRIMVTGGRKEDRVKFYTGLYHALSGRGISNDINGQYVKIGGGVGQIPMKDGKPAYSHYNSDATWGGFWNFLQLWGMAYPEVLNEYIQSHLDHYRDIGWLPDGLAAGAFTPGMPSNFLGLFISSAYNWKIRQFDTDLAWKAALKNELEWKNRPTGVGKYDLGDFVAKGYVPIEHTFKGYKFSGSHTLEYAFSSWAVGQYAKALGKQAEYERLNKMGLAYRTLIDPGYKMVRAKDQNGDFIKDFTLTQVWNGFQEGNSWQYSWYAPQDVQGLIRIMGKENFNQRLDSIFKASSKNLFGGGKVIHSFAGLEAIYNHGNQPCLHIPYLFNFSGKPWLTQKWVRQIMDVFYGTNPLHGYGYGQDEDQGQLGAWYVISAMGLFDVQGGSSVRPTMQLSSSPFDKITIRLNKDYFPGERFEIITRNNKPGHVYIQSATLNGKVLNKPWIYFDEITRGGVLQYTVGPQPNTKWGSDPQHAPPSTYSIDNL
jgi:predicted alpha-1,2-mannosidase